MGESPRIGSVIGLYYLSIVMAVLTLVFSMVSFLGFTTLWTSPVAIFFTLIQAIVVVVKQKKQRQLSGDPDMPTIAAAPGLATCFLITLFWLVPLAFNAAHLARGIIATKDGFEGSKLQVGVVFGLVGGELGTIVIQILTLLTIFGKGIAERRENQRRVVNEKRAQQA
ncbi:hypothetical protein FA15DRAFT_666884 [Coprinopsis marcescibilis]|uniref:Uncharacterized protein n=1 Tax=Coprinopsis marcescibilis TaxID=230819 RepID=A0A5C3L2H4_COPMA|nr:hypothetical protein FA15DRAFT_666884 [Coprinopsis marcescibilis]